MTVPLHFPLRDPYPPPTITIKTQGVPLGKLLELVGVLVVDPVNRKAFMVVKVTGQMSSFRQAVIIAQVFPYETVGDERYNVISIETFKEILQ